MGWILNSWWLILGTSISHQSLRPNDRIWFWLTMLSLTLPTRKHVSKRRRHGRNGSEDVHQIWSDSITILTWLVPLSGCRLPSYMSTLNILLGQTMMLSPSKQKINEFCSDQVDCDIFSAFARIENHYFVNEVRPCLLQHQLEGWHLHITQGFMREGQLLESQEIDKMYVYLRIVYNIFFYRFFQTSHSNYCCARTIWRCLPCTCQKNLFAHERSLNPSVWRWLRLMHWRRLVTC